MTVPVVSLDAGDAVELGELLEFLVGWLGFDRGRLASSFSCFMGCGGYDIDGLRSDLSRFAFVLGGNDGEVLLGASR
jgi:hypothetical protein